MSTDINSHWIPRLDPIDSKSSYHFIIYCRFFFQNSDSDHPQCLTWNSWARVINFICVYLDTPLNATQSYYILLMFPDTIMLTDSVQQACGAGTNHLVTKRQKMEFSIIVRFMENSTRLRIICPGDGWVLIPIILKGHHGFLQIKKPFIGSLVDWGFWFGLDN